MSGFKVAAVGATGMVGRELIRLLEKRRFPLRELRLFATQRSSGQRIPFRGRGLRVEKLSKAGLRDCRLAFFSTDEQTTRRFAPWAVFQGAWVVDESSTYRMDPQVPLVVPEINARRLRRDRRLIAGPNCSTVQLVLALYPLHLEATLRRVWVASYQSVSGAGGPAMRELEQQARAWARGRPIPSPRLFPRRILFNLFPQIGGFGRDGLCLEERKIVREVRKILGLPRLGLSAITVRVPVFRGHSEAVWVQTRRALSERRAVRVLRRFPGLRILRNPNYPTPLDSAGALPVFVGRVRQEKEMSGNVLSFWVVADNLLKGAAFNAVQIAEELLLRRWL
ncbi:MAG: aspartate-semialdehyde dehydrogenase [Elusimicrobia bacterium]|nr:aspartate-semialdehyde dehydrogenase [Elusimicrobiota bacterium]